MPFGCGAISFFGPSLLFRFCSSGTRALFLYHVCLVAAPTYDLEHPKGPLETPQRKYHPNPFGSYNRTLNRTRTLCKSVRVRSSPDTLLIEISHNERRSVT